jgi:hypothetical protein
MEALAIKLREPSLGMTARAKARQAATTKTKYRGLSTAQQTMRLSVASVEMTCFFGGRGSGDGRSRSLRDGSKGMRY